MSDLQFECFSGDVTSLIVTGAATTNGELVIPETVPFGDHEATVRWIAPRAFRSAKFTKVVFPRTLNAIGAGAFADNAALRSVEFAGDCEPLTICDDAFARCGNLTSVSLPGTLSVVSRAVVRGCANLSAVCGEGPLAVRGKSRRKRRDLQAELGRLPLPLVRIGEGCFIGTKIPRIALPRSLESIGSMTFMGTWLVEITIPDAVTRIGDRAFEGSAELLEVTLTPKSRLQRVGARAFAKTGIRTSSFPATLVELGPEAFAGCENLLDISFERGSRLKEIRRDTFAGANVEMLSVPAIRAISPDAFEGLNALISVRFSRAAGGVFELPPGLFGGSPEWVSTTFGIFERVNGSPIPE
jgi:hypothetical protein